MLEYLSIKLESELIEGESEGKMLAERKQKVKWSEDPQNTQWTKGVVIKVSRYFSCETSL